MWDRAIFRTCGYELRTPPVYRITALLAMRDYTSVRPIRHKRALVFSSIFYSFFLFFTYLTSFTFHYIELLEEKSSPTYMLKNRTDEAEWMKTKRNKNAIYSRLSRRWKLTWSKRLLFFFGRLFQCDLHSKVKSNTLAKISNKQIFFFLKRKKTHIKS